MIVTRSWKVHLQQTFRKVFCLATVPNDTFVFLAVVSQGRDALYQCDRQGRILFDFRFEFAVESLVMASEWEAVVLAPKQNRVYVFDLQRGRRQFFLHQFLLEEADQSEACFFSNSRFFCIRQKGHSHDHRLRLTYYSYPFPSTAPTPIACFYSRDNQWTSQMQIFKANSHSLFAWCRRRQDQEIDVRTFHLQGNPRGEFRQYRFKSTLGVSYNLHRVDFCISNLFQIAPYQLCLVCISSKNEARACNKDGVVNNNFILNTENPHAPFIAQSRFYFQGTYNDRLIDCLSLGSYFVFHTYDFEHGKALPSPVFYLNSQQQVVCTQTWVLTYLIKFFVPGYTNNVILECEMENGLVNWFNVHRKTILTPSLALQEILKEMIEDEEWHPDLLLDVYEFLHPA